jgi:tetratricopeptide (TPR) repeat protein
LKLVAILALAAFVAGAASPAALAEQAPAASSEAAKAHFDQGVVQYNLGRFPEAIAEFEKAYEVDHEPSILYNIAQAHKKQGNKEKALFFYRRYLEQAPNAPNRAEVEQRVKDLASVVEKGDAKTPAPPPRTEPKPQPKPQPLVLAPPPPPPPAPASQPSAMLVSSPAPAPADQSSVFSRPWFWVVVGAAVSAGVVAAIVLSRGAQDPTASLGHAQGP